MPCGEHGEKEVNMAKGKMGRDRNGTKPRWKPSRAHTKCLFFKLLLRKSHIASNCLQISPPSALNTLILAFFSIFRSSYGDPLLTVFNCSVVTA